MLIVYSTEEDYVCHVETKNLDGETNLKNKSVPKKLQGKFEHTELAIKNFDGTIIMDGPNNLIYKFDGNLNMEEKHLSDQLLPNNEKIVIPLSNDNIVLRGMSLRNT